MPADPEFYAAMDRFIEDKVVSMPASYEVAIEALETKAADLRRKIGQSERINASDIDPTAGDNPNFNWDGDG